MLTRRLHWALVSGAALLCTKLPPLHCADNNSDNKRTRPASVITAKLPKEPVGLLDRAGQVVVCLSLGLLSKFIMQVLNSTTFVDTEKLVDVLKDDSRQRGVLTVCNHVSAVDDPGTIAAMLPLTWFFTPERIRWTICAKDRCFKNALTSVILSHGRVLPVERGKGVHQPMMDDVIAKLSQGDWVHMFPEGTRSRGGTLQPLKLGVGRMVTDATVPPLVVPFVHDGMEHILRVGEWIPLNVGQRLWICVGDPIDFAPLINEYRATGKTEHELHTAITERIGVELVALQRKVATAKGAS